MSSPLKPTLKSEALSLFVLLLTAVCGYYFYFHFPETVATHWNFAGQVDNWGSGKTNAIALPLVILGMYLMFLVLPFIDPRKERYEQFAKVYSIFKGSFLGFMLIIYFLTGLYNLGYNIPIGKIIPLLIGILFIIIGNYMGKIKYNWFVGVKTPWTLSSEEVWNKTHRFSGKIFILAGFAMMATPWLQQKLALALFIITILSLTFGTMGYSYYIYKKIQNNTGK